MQPPPRRAFPQQARAVAVTDGETVVLEEGYELRLTGIQAPRLALGRKGLTDWPLAADAKTALERIALGKMLKLYPGATAFDRYGRILAQAYADGVWVQGAMLEQGMARVYTLKDNRACTAELYAQEASARQAGRGLWALKTYQIRAADHVAIRDQGQFVLVEGRVVSAAVFDSKAYLNFGPDYRTDFTAVVNAADLALFRAEGYDLKGLRGQRVRVRGWLELWNGPMIDVTHPEEIERLGSGTGSPETSGE